MSAENIALTKKLFECYTKKDRKTIGEIIDKDFHFLSPLDNRITRETYFDRCWPLSEQAGEFNFVHIVADGPRVFVIYESKDLDGRTFRNTEVHTFENREAVEVEVYFGWGLPHKAPPGGFIND